MNTIGRAVCVVIVLAGKLFGSSDKEVCNNVPVEDSCDGLRAFVRHQELRAATAIVLAGRARHVDIDDVIASLSEGKMTDLIRDINQIFRQHHSIIFESDEDIQLPISLIVTSFERSSPSRMDDGKGSIRVGQVVDSAVLRKWAHNYQGRIENERRFSLICYDEIIVPKTDMGWDFVVSIVLLRTKAGQKAHIRVLQFAAKECEHGWTVEELHD